MDGIEDERELLGIALTREIPTTSFSPTLTLMAIASDGDIPMRRFEAPHENTLSIEDGVVLVDESSVHAIPPFNIVHNREVN